MIDTINLRLHGCEKYRQTINGLVKFKEGSTKSTILSGEVDEFTGAARIITDGKKASILYHDSNNYMPISYNNSLRLSSHSYRINFMVNYSKDYINFEFSIPKYIKGHNIYQFIYYDNPKDAYNLYKKLLRFIRDFFNRISIQYIDFNDVEVKRIDLCFNQTHISRTAAIRQLNEIKNLSKGDKKRHKGLVVYKESVMWKNEHYTFKIYHKGPEFLKHDFEELTRGKRYGKEDIAKLQDAADKILRYEITYRNSFMSYLFHRLYRVNRSPVKNEIYRKVWKGLNIEDKEIDNYLVKVFRLSSFWDNRDNWKDADNRRKALLFQDNKKVVTFTLEMFEYLMKHFWYTVQKNSVMYSLDEEQARKKFIEYDNDEDRKAKILGRKRFNLNIMNLMRYYHLSRDKPLAFYCPDLFSKITLARTRKIFKACGLADYNPDNKLTKVDFEFRDYKLNFGIWH